jgi:hypothetical protein
MTVKDLIIRLLNESLDSEVRVPSSDLATVIDYGGVPEIEVYEADEEFPRGLVWIREGR